MNQFMNKGIKNNELCLDTFTKDNNIASTIIESERFKDFKYAKDFICYQVINTEINKKLLLNIPHINMLDLSYVFNIVDIDNHTIKNYMITNELMLSWKVSVEELFELSLKNTMRLFEHIISPMEIVMEKLGMIMVSFDENVPDIQNTNTPLYVCSNLYMINGAGVVFYPKLLMAFADMMNCNLYILPSSIHETLIMLEDDNIDTEELKNMVREVNKTLTKKEILSDNVYFYNRFKNVITIC